MKKSQHLSNSFLVYGTVFLSILIYIFGVLAVIHFVKEATQTGFLEAFLENTITTGFGILCLFLATPSYRFTKTLRILEITSHDNRPAILTVYSPFFISDIPLAESKITIQNLKKVNQNNYFSRLVELRIDQNGTQRIIKSFINPKLQSSLKNTVHAN